MVEPATASLFPSTESLLAPLIVGFHRDASSTNYLDLSVRAAMSAMPSTRVGLNLLFQGERKARTVAHDRSLLKKTGDLGNIIMRLCDRRAGESAEAAWPRWRWEVTCAVIESSNGQLPIPEAQTNIRFIVSRFQLSSGRIDSSTQLAFFRHLAVEGLRGIDPQLVVLGGQHDWHDAWWTVQTEKPS